MSVWNNSLPEERIIMWREFREGIRTLPYDEKINKVAIFFAKFPIGSRSIDFYTPESWPNPWEILYHKKYCTSSISLLMYHTLSVTVTDRLVSIILIDDTKDRFLVPITDNKYIFNYILGEISNIHDFKEIKIIDDFVSTSIPHIS